MKVVDCFIFYNELDILELRLDELYSVVDSFVIVEATHTFTGNRKEMIFEANRDRYAKYMDKIVYIQVNDMPNTDAWTNEFFHRNAIARSFRLFDKDDIVLISDVDEIPRKSVVANIRSTQLPARLVLDFYTYNFNCFINNFVWRTCTVAYRLGDITTSIQECRKIYTPNFIENAGWHFSWFGDKEFCVNKIKNFAHQELNNEETLSNFSKNFDENKEYHMSRNYFNFTTKPLDSTLPDAVISRRFPFIEKYIKA